MLLQCDATDSSSCTECSSRNVKCQFTKETNRRMSNIRSASSYTNGPLCADEVRSFRHNQDLQKELAQAKYQVDHLRSMLETGKDSYSAHRLSAADLPDPDSSHLPTHNLPHLPVLENPHLHMAEESPGSEERQPKRRKVVSTIEPFATGLNMERQGHGIFKSPYPLQRPSSPKSPPSSLPTLPPKHIADALIRQYHFTLHPTLPIIHWPSFQEQYDAVYKVDSLQFVPRIWVALLYAIFACGTLHRSWRDGKKYLETSRDFTDIWTENSSLDHARTALLNCIYSVEVNLKSAGWIWIGIAVRISFDIGLHCEAGTWSAIEEEMRRRVWWSIYTCDW